MPLPDTLLELPPKSLPPRLLVWHASKLHTFSYERAVWLTGNQPIIVMAGRLAARVVDGNCEIIPLGDDSLLLNGVPLTAPTQLHDGDFIFNAKSVRVIFDADPAEKWEQICNESPEEFPKYMEKRRRDLLKLKLSQRVAERIYMIVDGMSVDAGQVWYRWQDIACVSFDEGWVPVFRRSMSIYVADAEGGMTCAAQLVDLNRRDCKALLEWLNLGMPIDVPFRYGLLFGDTIHALSSQSIKIQNLETYVEDDFELLPQFGEKWRKRFMFYMIILALYWIQSVVLTWDEVDNHPSDTLSILLLLGRIAVLATVVWILASLLILLIAVVYKVIASFIKLLRRTYQSSV